MIFQPESESFPESERLRLDSSRIWPGCRRVLGTLYVAVLPCFLACQQGGPTTSKDALLGEKGAWPPAVLTCNFVVLRTYGVLSCKAYSAKRVGLGYMVYRVQRQFTVDKVHIIRRHVNYCTLYMSIYICNNNEWKGIPWFQSDPDFWLILFFLPFCVRIPTLSLIVVPR